MKTEIEIDNNSTYLCNLLLKLAEDYDKQKVDSIEKYLDAIKYVISEVESKLQFSIEKECREILKIFIENPDITEKIKSNPLGCDIVELALVDAEKMQEFKLVAELKSAA